MANPYHYGSPVTGEQFAGRHEELRALTGRMRDGINVTVVSPRRYGKTSLLHRASERAARDGASVVSVTAMGVADPTAFATQLLAGLYRAKGGKWHRAKQAVPEFLKRFSVTPSVTFDGDSPSFALSPRLGVTDVDTVLGDVYATLAELSEQRPAVLVVDEFQDVLRLGGHLPSLFKALADRHPKVSLVLAGSKRHVMEQLVLDRTAPLYGMTAVLALSPIPPDVMSEFLVRRAVAGGKQMPAAVADRVVELAGPVPNDIQYLAYETYGAAGQQITETDVETGLRLAVEHESDFDSWRFDALPAGQRRVLSRLAHSPTAQPYGEGFRQAANVSSPGALRNALTALLEQDVVTVTEGTYRVTSPFFAAWLRAHS